MLEHPMVTQINRYGYPQDLVKQPEHNGFDFYGQELLVGDKFYEFDGDIVSEENLEKFLVEELGFEIKEAI